MKTSKDISYSHIYVISLFCETRCTRFANISVILKEKHRSCGRVRLSLFWVEGGVRIYAWCTNSFCIGASIQIINTVIHKSVPQDINFYLKQTRPLYAQNTEASKQMQCSIYIYILIYMYAIMNGEVNIYKAFKIILSDKIWKSYQQ